MTNICVYRHSKCLAVRQGKPTGDHASAQPGKHFAVFRAAAGGGDGGGNGGSGGGGVYVCMCTHVHTHITCKATSWFLLTPFLLPRLPANFAVWLQHEAGILRPFVMILL